MFREFSFFSSNDVHKQRAKAPHLLEFILFIVGQRIVVENSIGFIKRPVSFRCPGIRNLVPTIGNDKTDPSTVLGRERRPFFPSRTAAAFSV